MRRALIAVIVIASYLMTTVPASAEMPADTRAPYLPGAVASPPRSYRSGSALRGIGIALTLLGAAAAGVSLASFGVSAIHSSDNSGDVAPAALGLGLVVGASALGVVLPGIVLWDVGDDMRGAAEAGQHRASPKLRATLRPLGAAMTVVGTVAMSASMLFLFASSSDRPGHQNAFAADLGWGIGLGAAGLGLVIPGIVLWSANPWSSNPATAVGGGPPTTLGASLRWKF